MREVIINVVMCIPNRLCYMTLVDVPERFGVDCYLVVGERTMAWGSRLGTGKAFDT
jgi:hypothetical protein